MQTPEKLKREYFRDRLLSLIALAFLALIFFWQPGNNSQLISEACAAILPPMINSF